MLQGKVGVAVGWTDKVLVADGLGAARFGFDRLLGVNKDTDWGGAKTPKQRPWNWVEVMGEIGALGKGSSVDANHNAQLAFVGSDQLLAPSIATIDVEENAKQFVLHGAFGTGSGDHKVTLASTPDGDGAELGGCNWQPDTVKCNVDGQQAGYVRAISNGHKSNPIAVTRFHPKLTWHFHGGEPAHGIIDLTAVMDIYLRVDVQTYRRHASEDPKARDPFRVAPSQDSTCKFTTTGYGVDSKENKVPITGSGSADVVGPYASVVPPGANTPMGQFTPANVAAMAGIAMPAGMPDPQLMMGAPPGKCLFGGLLDPKVGTTFAAAVSVPNSIVVKGYSMPGGFAIAMFEKKGGVADVLKRLTLNMGIATGAQGGDVTLLGDHLDQPGKDGDISLDWSDTKGEFPPDAQSAR